MMAKPIQLSLKEGDKVFMGGNYRGAHRVTFLIGPDGRIRKIWPQAKPEEHAPEVLAAL